METAATPNFMSQADFARRRGVSKKTVTVWKQGGLVVLNEAGMVDVEATEWKLDDRPANYRGGVTHRPIRAPDHNNHHPKTERPKSAETGTLASIDRPAEGAPDPADFDWSDPSLPMTEAVRRKENFLGLTRKHEYEVAKGEWVRVEDVGQAVEREYSVVRERLLAIPGKLASKLEGLDRTAIELALLDEVTETLNELHEPDEGGGTA
jgi:hypothetical protein